MLAPTANFRFYFSVVSLRAVFLSNCLGMVTFLSCHGMVDSLISLPPGGRGDRVSGGRSKRLIKYILKRNLVGASIARP